MSERVVVVDWPQIAKRGETLFPGALVVYANGSLPIEALETDDCIIVSTNAERLTDFCQQVVSASCRLVRYSTDDISAFTTREEVVQWHQQGGLAEYKGSPIPNPAPQVQKPAKPIPPGAANEAPTEPDGAGLDEPPEWMNEIPDALEMHQHSVRIASDLKKQAFSDSESYEWGEPADFWGATSLPAFDLTWLPAPLRDRAFNIHQMQGCDLGIPGVQIRAIAAGCIDQSIKVAVKKQQDWYEGVRLWTCILGRSGDGKSPSMQTLLRALDNLTAEVQDDLKRKMAKYKLDMEYWEVEKRAYFKARQEGKHPQAPEQPERPVAHQVYFDDATVESICEVLQESTRGSMLVLDEALSWLNGMNSYKSGGNDRQFFMSAADGTKRPFNRMGRMWTMRAGLSMVGLSTPHALQQSIAKSSLESDGFLQRVMVWNSERDLALGSNIPVDNLAKVRWARLVENLYRLKSHLDHCYFSPEAQELFTEAEQWISRSRQNPSMPPAAQEHVSKYRGWLARIALADHCILAADDGREAVTPEISYDTLERAWRYLRDGLFPHAMRFYTSLDVHGSNDALVKKLAEYVLARNVRYVKPHKINSAWGNVKHSLTIAQWKEFWAQAERMGWARGRGPVTKSSGLCSDYEINPLAFDGRFSEPTKLAMEAVQVARLNQHPEFLAQQGRQPGED